MQTPTVTDAERLFSQRLYTELKKVEQIYRAKGRTEVLTNLFVVNKSIGNYLAAMERDGRFHTKVSDLQAAIDYTNQEFGGRLGHLAYKAGELKEYADENNLGGWLECLMIIRLLINELSF